MLHFKVKSVCMCLLCFFTFVKLEPGSDPIRYDLYRTLDEIDEFIENILTTYNETSEIILGSSYENRPIRGVKLSRQTEGSSMKPAILVDGGIHAREWASTAAILFTLGQLTGNSSHSGLVQGLDWYFLPVLNPDGYNYSMTSKGNRLWRKNMRLNEGSECRGVDLNRNFDFAWGGPGSSENPCDWNYRGPSPFSEPESRALGDFIKRSLPQLKMYLTLHSAAQAIIYPWGFTEERPEDWEDLVRNSRRLPRSESRIIFSSPSLDFVKALNIAVLTVHAFCETTKLGRRKYYQDLDKLARQAAKEMSLINGTTYDVGPTIEVVDAGAGGSDDWTKGSAGVKWVYTVELPGPEHPDGGFNPAPSSLRLIGEEVFRGIQVFARHLISTTTSPAGVSSTPRQEKPPKSKEDPNEKKEDVVYQGYVEPAQWYNPAVYSYLKK